jgi:hypothetical protein
VREREDSAAGEARESATAGRPEELEAHVKKFGVQAYSFFYGPMLSDPGAGTVPTTWVDSYSGVSTQNQIGLVYNLNDQFQLTPVFDFEVLISDPNHTYGNQYLALTYDSFVKLSTTSLASFNLGAHEGSLAGDIRYYVPTGEYSRENNSLGSVRLTLTPSVQLAHTGVTLSLVNFVRYFLQRQSTETFDKKAHLGRMQLYTAPLVTYALNDRVALWGLLESSVTYDTRWSPNTRDANRSLVDFEPGIDFRLNENVVVSPYLNWYFRQGLDTTTVNVTASLSL